MSTLDSRAPAVGPPGADTKTVAPDPSSIPGLEPVAYKYAGANTTPRSNNAGSRAAEQNNSPVGRPPIGVPKAHLTKVSMDQRAKLWKLIMTHCGLVIPFGIGDHGHH